MNSYDFVIVGGGSAGCVLANRLSASGKWQVLLLEAGPADGNSFIHIPAGIIPVIRSNVLNWKFWTTPQPNCGGRPMFWPRGRTLGGSSSINAMCYIRGNAWDYDHWASLGNDGWSYKDVLPYFRKMENFEAIDKLPGARGYHGSGGPLNVAEYRYLNPLMSAFVDAAQQAGHPRNGDFNGAQQDGIGYYHVMQQDGQRCSNARGFLKPALGRANLKVITGAHAAKVLFEGRRAAGVRYLENGRYAEALARKEVILSAGAIGSPQLLLLSGVGPRAQIEKQGIQPVHELPGVGENLQDHLDIHVTWEEKTRFAVTLHWSSLWRTLKSVFQYLFGHRGELTSNLAHGQNLTPLFKYYAFTLMTCFLRPESRGTIRLASADPLARPLIDANYLATPRDMEALVKGFKLARQVLQQPAFAPHRLQELEPGAAVQSDEQIRDFIRRRAETVYHPVGTCKMGRDAMAVVDPRLRVHGLEGLRVVDASVMPTLIGGNTNAPTTMIAERAADLILQDAALGTGAPGYATASAAADVMTEK